MTRLVEQFDLSPAGQNRIGEIRKALHDAGFNESNVLDRLGEKRIPGIRIRRSSINEYLPKLGDEKLDVVIKAFVLGQPVPIADLVDAIKPLKIEDWCSAGLVSVNGGRVYPLVELCPFGEMISAADWPSNDNDDDVMGIAASSQALLQMTVRRKAGSAFDLGCGNGIQSLAASRHCDSVTGTDINARAVHFARFNAILNGRSNTSFSVAGLYDGVKTQKFDLLVCNPPFVIGPRALHTHTSTGAPSDTFCETIIRMSPEYLDEGGYAQFVCNWAQIGDEAADGHIKKWVENNGCDTWILHSHSESAEDYASARAKENASDPVEVKRLHDEWMSYLNGQNITAVNFGVINMRRSGRNENWFRYDELPGAAGPCGRSIEQGFLLQDFLRDRTNDRELLNSKYRVAPELEFSDKSPAELGRKAQMRLKEGLTFAANVAPEIESVVKGCDGRSPLEQVIQKVTHVSRTSFERMLPHIGPVVRVLVNFGFLIPIDILSNLDK